MLDQQRRVLLPFGPGCSLQKTGMAKKDTVVVGASAGGVQTLSTLVAQLPSEHSLLLRKLLLSDQKGDIGDELIQTGDE